VYEDSKILWNVWQAGTLPFSRMEVFKNMNSLPLNLDLLLATNDLPQTIAIAIALVTAALFYQFYENLFDILGVGGSVRRLFNEEWARFEETIDAAGISDALADWIRDWVLDHQARQPSEFLINRQLFDICIQQIVDSEEFSTHPTADDWLKQLRHFRSQLGLMPVSEDTLLSTRELEAPLDLALCKTHPDFEHGQDRVSLGGPIERINDREIELSYKGSDETFKSQQDVWVSLDRSSTTYRFQSTIQAIGSSRLILSHGRFLIQEKRGDPRIKHDQNLKILWYDGDDSRDLEVQLIDISRSGFALASDSLVPLRTFIQLDLPLKEGTVLEDLEAEVLDVTPYQGGQVRLHCRLINPDVSEELALDLFIEETQNAESP
jgi:hypothetical protein